MSEPIAQVNPKDKVECPICGTIGNWVNVDEYRLKPGGMEICTKCGFVTYPEIVAKNEELKQFYRKEYRPGPTVQNLFTGNRKLHYHAEFLGDLLEQWKKEGRKAKVFEVGAAFGMFLNWFKRSVPKSEVSGSELTLAFRRVAYHQYGVELAEEFDTSKQYDLIASYKVAEHIAYIDKELRNYALALKPTGFLYISVPTWFHSMTNFGVDGFSLDYYYDKNHINVWTRKLFETLLAKSGLEIVKENHVYYDATYLCKRNDEMMKKEPQYEAMEEIIDRMSRIHKASFLYDESKFEEAIAVFPNYPEAHIAKYEKNRQSLHALGFDGIEKAHLMPAQAACPDSHKIAFHCADLAMRYESLDKALVYLDIAQQRKPGDPASLISIANCYRQMANKQTDPNLALELINESHGLAKTLHQVSLQHSHESITWMFQDEAKMPMPSEFKKAEPKKEIPDAP